AACPGRSIARPDGSRAAHVDGEKTMTNDRATPATLAEALDALERAADRIAALERAESRFRMLAEGVPNHLLFLDRDLRIEFANRVFLEAAGWTAEDARGRHISELLGPERYLARLP